MTQFVKRFFKEFLRKRHRRLLYLPANTVAGFDLVEDMQLVIGTSSPVCLDVGANEGQTIELLKKTFAQPAIHSFEPSPKMFRILQSNPASHGVTLRNAALGKQRGQLEFINYENSHLSSFLPLDPHEGNRFRETKVESKEVVEVDTVDHYLEENRITRVDLLKIDTQGFDMEVLAGARESLRNGYVRHILIELNFVRLYEGQSLATDILKFLEEYQFALVDYYEKVRQDNAIAWCTALFSRQSNATVEMKDK